MINRNPIKDVLGTQVMLVRLHTLAVDNLILENLPLSAYRIQRSPLSTSVALRVGYQNGKKGLATHGAL